MNEKSQIGDEKTLTLKFCSSKCLIFYAALYIFCGKRMPNWQKCFFQKQLKMSKNFLFKNLFLQRTNFQCGDIESGEWRVESGEG